MKDVSVAMRVRVCDHSFSTFIHSLAQLFIPIAKYLLIKTYIIQNSAASEQDKYILRNFKQWNIYGTVSIRVSLCEINNMVSNVTLYGQRIERINKMRSTRQTHTLSHKETKKIWPRTPRVTVFKTHLNSKDAPQTFAFSLGLQYNYCLSEWRAVIVGQVLCYIRL